MAHYSLRQCVGATKLVPHGGLIPRKSMRVNNLSNRLQPLNSPRRIDREGCVQYDNGWMRDHWFFFTALFRQHRGYLPGSRVTVGNFCRRLYFFWRLRISSTSPIGILSSSEIFLALRPLVENSRTFSWRPVLADRSSGIRWLSWLFGNWELDWTLEISSSSLHRELSPSTLFNPFRSAAMVSMIFVRAWSTCCLTILLKTCALKLCPPPFSILLTASFLWIARFLK